MDRSARVLGVTAAGMLALGIAAEMARRRGAADRVRLQAIMPAEAGRVVDLVRQVEREPELIPGVESVRVLERGPDWVRYRVNLPAGMIARFCKAWDETRIAWDSEAGSFGLDQTGLMRLTPLGNRTRVDMKVRTAFQTPVLGPLLAALSHPFAEASFRAWLDNLARALSEGEAGPAGS